MKVLMLFPYAPLPPPLDLGGTKRNLPFLRENLKYHEVSVLSFGTQDEEKLFRKHFDFSCKNIVFVNRKRPRIINGIEQLWLLATGRSTFRQLYRKEMQRQIDRMCQETAFDVIHCCTQMFGYFRFPPAIPVVSDTHEVTYDLVRRMYEQTKNPFSRLMTYLTYRLGKPEELALCAKFDALIATTERDRGVFSQEIPQQHIVEIGNGVNSEFFEDTGVTPEPETMVFTGKMNFFPNNQGIHYFLDEIFPLILSRVPNARIFVVGAYPGDALRKRASENVTVTGFVDDVRPYVARAQVYIIPLLVGGGIRGKALEAMAMKRPIVTTTIGCEGIHLEHGKSALFADEPRAFAEAVVRLFEDESLRSRLVLNALNTVQMKYDWNTKGGELTRLYESVIERRSAMRHTGSNQMHPA